MVHLLYIYDTTKDTIIDAQTRSAATEPQTIVCFTDKQKKNRNKYASNLFLSMWPPPINLFLTFQHKHKEQITLIIIVGTHTSVKTTDIQFSRV